MKDHRESVQEVEQEEDKANYEEMLKKFIDSVEMNQEVAQASIDPPVQNALYIPSL